MAPRRSDAPLAPPGRVSTCCARPWPISSEPSSGQDPYRTRSTGDAGSAHGLEPDEEGRLLAACAKSKNKGSEKHRGHRSGEWPPPRGSARADVGPGRPEPWRHPPGADEVREEARGA